MRGRVILGLVAGSLLVHAPWASATTGCDAGDATSMLQTRTQLTTGSKTRQPYGQADRSLQAPPEGGSFSDFFNSRTEGHGIHKWLQYFPAYQRHLGKFIGKEVHIVEIGIQSGGSLDMWKSVLGPGARVYGCDVDPQCRAYEDDHTQIFIGDQEQPAFWENFTNHVPKIDILIDDGGHTPDQQIATLGMMLKHLSPEGVYITEDVHGRDNEFWQRLQLEQLDSPGGHHFEGLGHLVSSIHIYPYLLVIERSGSTNGGEAMRRQLGTNVTDQADQPIDVRLVVDGTAPQPVASSLQSSLQQYFPALSLSREESSAGGNLSQLMEGVNANGWLVVKDSASNNTFEDLWDAQADLFLSKVVSDFKLMHEGNCCNWKSNDVQKTVEALHIYPHLLIAKRTDGKERLVKAPQHGTSWIPYGAR